MAWLGLNERDTAAAALWNLASNNDDNQVSIAREGAVGPLIALLKNGSDQGKTNAAGALWNLAINADNQVSITREGAVGPLIALLKNGSDVGKFHAAGALKNLTINNAANKSEIKKSYSSIRDAYKKTTDRSAKSKIQRFIRQDCFKMVQSILKELSERSYNS